MAWIESHQELRDHPKVARLARLLEVDRATAIGMLHLLWWWALDHAESGDLGEYDAVDIADACLWEGPAETLVKALLDCGPGTREGFIEEVEGRWVLHNWWQYAGKLVARRRQDRERKQAGRQALLVGSPPDELGTSNGRPPDGAQTAYVTEQNRTEPRETPPAVERRPDVDALCDLLAELVEATGCPRPTITKAWRNDARLLLDKDKADRDEAERVMRWALEHHFWRSNVLSMPKFRAQYSRLRLQHNGSPKAAPAPSVPIGAQE